MDRHPLLLLQWLKVRGWLRRARRMVSTPRGIILTAVGLLVFVPQLIAFVGLPHAMKVGSAAHIRRFGPAFLLAFTALTLVFSSGKQALVFSPAEVAWLFSGPFGRKRLLLYKIGGQLGLTLFSSVFMTTFFGLYAPWPLAAYLGIMLSFFYLTLLTMVVGLAGSALGQVVFSWRKRLVLGLVVALVVFALLPSAPDLLTLSPGEIWERAESSLAFRVAQAPFQPFMRSFAAERWGALLAWSGLALLINAGLVGLCLALDASYYELATANSEKLYALREQMRRGQMGGVKPTLKGRGGKRWALPMLPWWGGAGPVAWRQATTAARDFARPLTMLISLLGLACVPVFATRGRTLNDEAVAYLLAGTILTMPIFLSILLSFDFRIDVDRIDTLKTWPIRPTALVLGQLATPVALVVASQWLALVVIGLGIGGMDGPYWAILAFAVPLNGLVAGVENLVFLWFPSRPSSGNPGDITVVGQAVLLMMAKFLVLGVAVGLAALLGVGGYFLAGWPGAAVLAWLVLAGFAAALVPLIATAFRNFDVARDTPA